MMEISPYFFSWSTLWVFLALWVAFNYILLWGFGMRMVGLTGSIGSGKSTVSNYLKKQTHLPIVCMDLVARKLVAHSNTPVFKEIVRQFGQEVVINTDGGEQRLNRAALGSLVRSDPALLAKLNRIYKWPLIRATLGAILGAFFGDMHRLIIMDSPLLFEKGFHMLTTCNVVVYVDADVQAQRLANRDGISVQEARQKIDGYRQLDPQIKADKGDFVIYNNGGFDDTYQQCDTAYEAVIRSRPKHLLKPNVMSVCVSGVVAAASVISIHVCSAVMHFVADWML